MNFIIIIALAIIQGATEFLPISSSGHLVLAYKMFGVQSNTILLSVILHLATLVSVIIYYRRDIWQLLKHPMCKTNISLTVSTIITCVIALVLKPNIESAFGGDWLWLGFVITAIVLIIAQYTGKKNGYICDITNLNISKVQAICIGIAQGVACFPGISRSGSTIATGLICKCDRDSATKYSFLLSIPIIIASTLLEVIEYANTPVPLSFNILELSIGFAVAMLVGLGAIHAMTRLVAKQKLYYFSFYLLILSTVVAFI